MKISNFKKTESILTKPHGNPNLWTMETGTVDITTGFLWWRKVETKKVFKEPLSPNWRFLDTGKFTPGYEVEALSIAYDIDLKIKEAELRHGVTA